MKRNEKATERRVGKVKYIGARMTVIALSTPPIYILLLPPNPSLRFKNLTNIVDCQNAF